MRQTTYDAGQSPPRFASSEDARRSSVAALFEVIDADQVKILRLFEAVIWHADDDDERLELYTQLRRELLAHLRAEEDCAYPSLAATDGTTVAHSLNEHRDIEAAIERLSRTPVGESWKHQLTALRSGILTHMKNEQQSLVPRARQVIPLEEQVTLGRAFEVVRNRHLAAQDARC
ncbi:MAG: hemerythrin domain-containing protein [Pseudomonadota bacterium]|nr:hemerythrin domain-containing protein [Pseudomonadota bacterium]